MREAKNMKNIDIVILSALDPGRLRNSETPSKKFSTSDFSSSSGFSVVFSAISVIPVSLVRFSLQIEIFSSTFSNVLPAEHSFFKIKCFESAPSEPVTSRRCLNLSVVSVALWRFFLPLGTKFPESAVVAQSRA